MKPTKDVVALVIDHGLFLPLADKLGQSFKKVYYYSPWEEGFPQLNKCIVGDGYETVERCDDFWEVLPDCDLAIFPDVQHSGLQLHLESLGKAVWGSRTADSIELSREKFHHTLKELELDCPGYKTITGLTKLREHLKGCEDKFIKISKYRGLMETWHHATFKESEPMIDLLAVKLGPAKDLVPFMVVDPVDTDLEIGYDGYCIDGQFPSLGVSGIEIKDQAYLCELKDYEDLPEQVLEVNEAFGPVLGAHRYRNFFSSEIRVKGKDYYFIDPCCRCPSPSTEAQIELYGNLPDIIWAGANGELVDPEPTAHFAAEVVLTMKGDPKSWRVMDIPAKVRPWVKCGGTCEIDGRLCVPPDGAEAEVGWIVGIGESVEDAIDNLFEHVAQMGDCPVKAHTEALADALKEMKSADEKGIDYAEGEIPEPAAILER